MTDDKRFTTTGNILHDGLANSKTITVETEEDAEILCGVLNDLNEKAELLDKITDIILSYVVNGLNVEKTLMEMKREQMHSLKKENEQLKKENQEYKALLQDMGMLMSDDEVKNIRNEMADKFIKPLLKSNGFDIDVDTTDGFTIIPNKKELKKWVNQKELEE